MDPIWGVDMGGTKIEGVILESRTNPVVLKRMRVPTEAHLGYTHILDQISKLIDVLMAETGFKPKSIGFSTPGVLDPKTQRMKNCNTTCLNDMHLKKNIESMLNIPIKMANDANCFAIAESQMGIVQEKAPNANVVFGVIMGSGVGGGIVVNGQVINGLQGIGGEWGHNFLDESGGDCYCGKVGCVERIISGPSLEKYYESISGVPKKLKEIVTLHQEGKDKVATQTVERLINYFGKGIASLINILDPDAIVIGGGVGNVDLLYTEGVKEVEKHVFNNRLDTVFLKPKLGDSAGVFGAAFL